MSTAEAPPGEDRGRVYIVCGGTRGDQQPVVMVGAQLKRMGYDVCMCIGPEGRAWVDAYGFEIMELASFKDTMRDTEGIRAAGETGDFQTLMANVAPALAQTLPGEVSELYARLSVDPRAVAVVTTSTHFQLSEVLARKFDVYGVSLFLSPFCRTGEFAPYMIDSRNPATWQGLPNPDGSTPGPFAEMAEYPTAANADLWEALLGQWATQWVPLLQLTASLCDSVPLVPEDQEDMIELLKNQIGCVPADPKKPMTSRRTDTLYAYSEQLVGPGGPADFTPEQRANQIGYIFDTQSQAQATALSLFGEDLQGFLERGDAPVYFGWGSMLRERNDELIRAAVAACKIGGRRGVVLGGWAHLSLDMLDAEKDAELLAYAKDNIFVCETCDHARLFPRCCCLVTHGGMGTLGSMLRSGKPSVVTPVWWDQNFAGDRVEALGVGRRGPHFASVTGENLAALIDEVTTNPGYAEKASEIAAAIAAEPRADLVAAQRVHEGVESCKASKRAAAAHPEPSVEPSEGNEPSAEKAPAAAEVPAPSPLAESASSAAAAAAAAAEATTMSDQTQVLTESAGTPARARCCC